MQTAHCSQSESTVYATSDDFQRIFSEEMNSLYLLGFLLTADARKAEECFVDGVGDSVQGNPVFKEWARSWARRTIIQRAIQMIEPAQENLANAKTEPSRMKIEPQLRAILELGALERFVYVMSVLEGYSYQECSILLGRSRGTIASARARAIRDLSNLAEIDGAHREGLQSTYGLVSN